MASISCSGESNSYHEPDISDYTILANFDTITAKNIFVSKAFSVSGGNLQGCATFNNIFFQFYDGNTIIHMYNLTTHEYLGKIMPEGTSSTTHCNNADFGIEYYAAEDEFPLLYLEEKSSYHKTRVYRIYQDEEGQYAAMLVQTLNFTELSQGCTTNNDIENGYMYVIYWKDNVKYGNKMYIPTFKEEETKISLKEKTLEKITITGTKVRQDATIHNRKLFQLHGYGGQGELVVTDLEAHKEVGTIDLTTYIGGMEPEGICWYDDHLLFSVSGGQVYHLYFVEDNEI